jgi:hypothetical protein
MEAGRETISQGFTVNFPSITRTATYRNRVPAKTHAANDAGRPLCGGGHGWNRQHAHQTDFSGVVNCRACLAILTRQALRLNPPGRSRRRIEF